MKSLILLLLVAMAAAQTKVSVGTLNNGRNFADQFAGATADSKINSAIAAFAETGGIVDATGLKGAQTIAATVTIPAYVVVLLHPNATFTCTVASAPCWSLTGAGAKLIGGGASFLLRSNSPSTQTGTILRMGAGITSTTDMIAVNPSATLPLGGFEVGNLTIDFANASSRSGRYGVATYGMMHSWIHDIQVYNAGVNGFEFETATSAWSYDNRLDNLLVIGAATSAFNWTTANATGAGDFDRWTCNLCKMSGESSNGTWYTQIPFHFTSGNAAGCTIGNMIFLNAWVGGTSPSGSPGAFQFEQGKFGYTLNIYVSGDLEQQNLVGNGYAVVLNNLGTASQVTQLDFSHVTLSGWKTAPFHNMTNSNVTDWSFQGTSGYLQAQQFSTAPVVRPTCTFTSGGGTSPSCALDTGSSDSIGSIKATTGSGSPAGTGSITLTFANNLGAHRPACVFMPSNQGASWAALASFVDTTPRIASDVFTWTNGTSPTTLTASSTYWINYFCGGH